MTLNNIWEIVTSHVLTPEMKAGIRAVPNVTYIMAGRIGFHGTEQERDALKGRVDTLIRGIKQDYSGCGHVNLF